MSARRDRRPPSGKVLNNPNSARREIPDSNLTPKGARPRPASAFPLHNASPRPSTSFAAERPQTSHGLSPPKQSSRPETNFTHAVPSSNRSDGSDLSVNEVLRRIKEKSEREKKVQEDKELDLMGPYNAFSRPKTSAIVPLRTVLLDPAVNNYPRSRTRTELMKRIKASLMPHPSYDLDNDGYVSTDDYKLAKRFDLDGNGVLDSDEREIGKRVLAEEFFKRHATDLHNFGTDIAQRSHKENVEKLVTSYSFERSYGKLMQVERTLNAESSMPMIECMSDKPDPLYNSTKYYANKFDTSAWNDMDRIPRAVLTQSLPSLHSLVGNSHSQSNNNNNSSSLDLFSSMSSNNRMVHNGSRKRLLFARKEMLRHEGQSKLIQTHSNNQSGNNNNNHSLSIGNMAEKGIAVKNDHSFISSNAQWQTKSFGRINLISDIRTENT